MSNKYYTLLICLGIIFLCIPGSVAMVMVSNQGSVPVSSPLIIQPGSYYSSPLVVSQDLFIPVSQSGSVPVSSGTSRNDNQVSNNLNTTGTDEGIHQGFLVTEEIEKKILKNQNSGVKLNTYSIEEVKQGSKSLLSKLPWTDLSKRDQGRTGTCWIWAATAVVEIDHTIDTGIKKPLSTEYFVRYYNYPYFCLDAGGFAYSFADFYMGGSRNPNPLKFIPWSNSNAEFKETKNSGCSLSYKGAVGQNPYYGIKSISFKDVAVESLTNAQFIADIKHEINSGRAVDFAIYWPSYSSFLTFNSAWNSNSGIYNPNHRKKDQVSTAMGHAMTIVGYNDVNRYWVVLNSWGTNSVHPSGTFKMAMDMDYSYKPSYVGWTYFQYTHAAIDWKNPKPVISSISPVSGINSGNVPIIIKGKNFRAKATVKLVKGNVVRTALVPKITSTKITCTLPLRGVTAGIYSITVRNSDGTTGTKSNAFTVKKPGRNPGKSAIASQ